MATPVAAFIYESFYGFIVFYFLFALFPVSEKQTTPGAAPAEKKIGDQSSDVYTEGDVARNTAVATIFPGDEKYKKRINKTV
jgi:hypothetical protein